MLNLKIRTSAGQLQEKLIFERGHTKRYLVNIEEGAKDKIYRKGALEDVISEKNW